ncbi:MAG: hypothetical protein ABS879_07525 [Eubacteriales bacterium]
MQNPTKGSNKDSAIQTTYYCTCHAVPRKMLLIQGGYSDYYACQNYLPENRPPGESVCLNRLNLVDAAGIYEKAQQLGGALEDEDGLLLASVLSRRGMKFTYNGIRAEVLKDTLEEFRIGINGKKL